MANIRFTIEVDCEDEEPSRVICPIQGVVFEHEEDSDRELVIGHISAFLVQRGRAMNEEEDVFEAMDCLTASARECFDALLDPEFGEWKTSVMELYDDEIIEHDLLLIESVELNPDKRSLAGC